jgi:hypothetical protein
MDSPRRIDPLLWLNLVCLDAPLVAVVWLWLFARTFHLSFQIGNAVALFLTAWLIYLADRFADSSTLKRDLPRSLRQNFCLQHRELWIVMIALVSGFDAYVIWRTTALQTFLIGAVVGLVAVIYLVVNHPLGLVWRSLPAKELAIGILFAAGTIVALLPEIPLTGNFAVAVLAFAALCALNCISIAGWERELDRVQGKVSIATRHPRIARLVTITCAAFGFVALVLGIIFHPAGRIFVCIGLSAFLLGWLSVSPRFKNSAQAARTALADLVLLTPIVFLIASML